MRAGADVVIFDGECGFCRSQMRFLARLDRRGTLRFLSAHDPETARSYPDLTSDELMEQMFVITVAGRRFGGVEAIRYLSRRLRWLWPIAPILHLPGTSGLWRWMYRQVARRRHSLGRNSSGCKVSR